MPHNKGKGKDTRKRKGTENNVNLVLKRQRNEKKPSSSTSAQAIQLPASIAESQPQSVQPTSTAGDTGTNRSNPSYQFHSEAAPVHGVGPSMSIVKSTDEEDEGDEGSGARDEMPPQEEWPKDQNEPLRRYPKTSKYMGSTRAAMGLPSLRSALQATSTDGPQAVKESFTMGGFLQRLIRWVVVDDQSIRVLECREFRNLLTYISDHLDDSDIPHRTKLTNDIIELYKAKQDELHGELKNAPGRISLMMDMWSDPDRVSYMALTAHWIAKSANGSEWTLQTRLLAFKHVKSVHSRLHLAEEVFDILKTAKILHKIGSITMDNASNNDKMMLHLASHLSQEGIEFDKDGNQIW
ncbi:hypothetical protein FRB90_006446 [Tulasnella sp. 427]|nr:hypothetical protein FRB90_006446 [Tulasnella sp. 427]